MVYPLYHGFTTLHMYINDWYTPLMWTQFVFTLCSVSSFLYLVTYVKSAWMMSDVANAPENRHNEEKNENRDLDARVDIVESGPFISESAGLERVLHYIIMGILIFHLTFHVFLSIERFRYYLDLSFLFLFIFFFWFYVMIFNKFEDILFFFFKEQLY